MSEHAALFGKAALVARNPERFESIPDLDGSERAALAYERDHKWHGPTMLWYAISLCAVGAATQGWDQTGSNGANLSFPQEFGLKDAQGYSTPRQEWYVTSQVTVESCVDGCIDFMLLSEYRMSVCSLL